MLMPSPSIGIIAPCVQGVVRSVETIRILPYSPFNVNASE
jgi:hypothetical protein